MNVLYLNNYMSEKATKMRHAENIYSQPANNKIKGITSSLLAVDTKVTILSSGLANGKSGKKYHRLKETAFGVDVIYCPIFDFPLLNTLSSIFEMRKEIKRQVEQNKIGHIIFYNYKPEVAWAAYYAKKKFGIPITVEYEDGYAHVEGIHGLKAWIFNLTEKFISKRVDSAIIVNSKLQGKYAVPTVTVRGVVDKDFYMRCKAYSKESNDKFTVLYSGGLDHERGIDVFIKSLEYLNMDCKVVITGKGSIECTDSRVVFKGFIPYSDVQKQMMQADLLVQCQRSRHDFAAVSFPSKLFEYIATGNAIVSSTMEDVVNFAGDSLEYYDNDDPRNLAGAIERTYKTLNDKKSKVQQLCEGNLPEVVGRRILSCWGE